MADSDERLVENAKKGDRKSFERLVVMHQRMALNTAYRILRNREDAEDAAQEAFIRAYTFIESLREGTKFGSWLCQIVTNICLTKTKASHSQQVFMDIDGEEAEARHQELRDPSLSPEEITTKEDFNQQVRSLVGSLPPQYRAVLTLYHLNDFSYNEISETLKLPIGTVKTHLFRAKEMLRRAVVERYSQEELCP